MGIEVCVFCKGEAFGHPRICVCGKLHPVCAGCEKEYRGMIDVAGLLVCPLSKEFKAAKELMGEEEEEGLAAFFRSSKKAMRKWRKENPF